MHKPYSALLPLFTWIMLFTNIKIKSHVKMKYKQTTLPALWKMYTIVFKYRKKKDNDYGLWMKHQIKLLQGYSNLRCMIWYNLKFSIWNIWIHFNWVTVLSSSQIKEYCFFSFKNKAQMAGKVSFLKKSFSQC